MPRSKAVTPSAPVRVSKRLQKTEKNHSPLQALATPPKRVTKPRVAKFSVTESAAAIDSVRVSPRQIARLEPRRRRTTSRQTTPEQSPEGKSDSQETHANDFQAAIFNNDIQDAEFNGTQEPDFHELQQIIESPSPTSSPLASIHEQSPPITDHQHSPSPTIEADNSEADTESDSSNYIRKTHEEEDQNTHDQENYIPFESSNSDSASDSVTNPALESDASSTPAAVPPELNSIAQVHSSSPATPAAYEVESIGVQTSPTLDTEPYKGSYADRRLERETDIIARAIEVPNIKIVIPRTSLCVDLAHFDDPIVHFTSSDIKNSLDVRGALYALAFKLTDTEKVDKLVRQRTQLLEIEEANEEKLAAKDAEIAKLKKQLRKVVRKSSETMTPSPKGLNENGKRSAPVDESDKENKERSASREKVRILSDGTLQLLDSDDPTVDNNLRHLIFNQKPTLRRRISIGSDEEQESFTQQSNPILWSANYALSNAPRDTYLRQKMINFGRAKRRLKRIQNGEGDYESDHGCDYTPHLLPAEEFVPRSGLPTTNDDNNDDNDNDTQIDEQSDNQDSVQVQDQAEDDRDQATTPNEAESEPQESSTALVIPEPPPQTPSRWGFTKLLGSVTRFVGRSPRSEPPRPQATEPHQETRQAVDDTPPAPHNTSASTGRTSTHRTPPTATNAPTSTNPLTAPIPLTGITSDDFAPAPLTPAQRYTIEHGRMSKTREERIRSYHRGVEAARRRIAAAEHAEMLDEHERMMGELRKQQAGQKRKRVRVDDLAGIPAGPPGTFSLIDEYFEQNSDGEDYVEVDEDVSMLDVFTPVPSPSPRKKVRFNDSPLQSSSSQPGMAAPLKSSMATPTRRTVIGDPHRAQPYLGTMFLSPKEREERKYQGANVFNESQGIHEEDADTTSTSMEELQTYAEVGRQTGYWTGPKAVKPTGPYSNPEGTFTVPEDSDDESEYDSENEITYHVPTEQEKLEQRKKDVEDFGNLFAKHKNSKSQEAIALSETTNKSEKDLGTSLLPPPPPTPAHASLPAGLTANNQSDSDALARARSQAEKYKPKTPSGLRAASKLASSPLGPETPSPPSAFQETINVIDPALIDPALIDPALIDPALIDPALIDPALIDPALIDPALIDPALIDPALRDHVPGVPVVSVEEEVVDEYAHQWVWPEARKPDLPELDEEQKARLAAYFASEEGIAYVDNYYKQWCPKEYWPAYEASLATA